MITLKSAENVLKEVYLGVVADQINTKTSPLFSKIRRTSRNIVGKKIHVVAPIGVNGGIMAGEETSVLPDGVGAPYLSLTSELKNLFGRFEISDKAIRASSTDVGSFVNLIQDNMDTLLKASMFNLSRMLYGDGSGLLATVTDASDKVVLSSVNGIAPGMYVDVYGSDDNMKIENAYVESVEPATKEVKLTFSKEASVAGEDKIYVHGSKDNEIIGLKGIVKNNDTLYGVDRSVYKVMNANNTSAVGSEAFDEEYVQSFIDDLEAKGTVVNFINTSYALKRLYQKYLTVNKKNIEYTTLEDGTKVITHLGTPIVPTNQIDDGECYFLNTDDLVFYELGDWKWLEDECGRILKQNPNKASFGATLVKYTELICQKPSGIAHVTGIKTTYGE